MGMRSARTAPRIHIVRCAVEVHGKRKYRATLVPPVYRTACERVDKENTIHARDMSRDGISSMCRGCK
eukprot:10496747-Alexandrium_andersonii.AAC.1